MTTSYAATYILPLRRPEAGDVSELGRYLEWLNERLELIVVDGSSTAVFCHHHTAWPGIRHVAPKQALHSLNGKVSGVLTGLELASHEDLIIADDDVRYDDESLARVLQHLQQADVVRPQNYFDPLPWHARWDTARSLINRVTGGDWPGL